VPRRLLAGAAGALAGGLAAVLGSFAHAATAGGAPAGLAAALGLSFACFVTTGLAARRRGPVALAAAAWVLVVLVLSLRRPEGDLVVPGTALGYAWLLGGTLAAAAAVSLPYAGVGPRPVTSAAAPPSPGRPPTATSADGR
jgi:hypothetical protein